MNRWLLVGLTVLFLSGCGPSVPRGVITTGKFTKGGTPLAPAADGNGAISVTLVSSTVGPDGSSAGGMSALDSSGAFRIVAAGKGIPPGKYRVQLAGDAGPGGDLFNGAYTGENYLKEVEVPADKVGGEFDLGTIELDGLKPMRSAAPAAASP